MTLQDKIELLLSNDPLEVATELKLEFISNGSSRRVFSLDEDHVLKVAVYNHRPKKVGIAQNKEEIRIAKDPLSRGKVAKLFAHDPNGTWVVAEKCDTSTHVNYSRIDRLENRCDKLYQKYGLCDIYEENAGINKEGNLVLVDYGFTDKTKHYYGQ